MCSIVGAISINGEPNIQDSELEYMIDIQSHRGSDGHGIFSNKDRSVLIGHGRLAIIDLSKEADQPFISNCSNYAIVFNGEIFNHIELRKELKNHGVEFRTNSDTEVLINAYIYWGDEFVNRLNGMWAFCIYDKVKRRTLLCRDRFGIKPLNYIFKDNLIIFSSEIKGIMSLKRNRFLSINFNSIHDFLISSIGAQNESTWINDIKRLPPATIMIVENNIVDIKKYWDYPSEKTDIVIDDSVHHEIKSLLDSSINIRFRSDVPVGITLSGGLDSSIIASCRDQGVNITGYVAHFGEGYKSELPYAQYIAKKSNVTLKPILINEDVIENNLENLVWHLESANTSLATLSLNEIMKEAKSDGIKVMLEGQGADEIFSGYYFYVERLIIEDIKKGNLKSSALEVYYNLRKYGLPFLKSFIRTLYPHLESHYKRYTGELSLYKKEFISLKEPEKHGKYSSREYVIKRHKGELLNLLHYGDAISMASTIESRLPFMDYRIVEYALSIPLKFHYKMAENKLLLKKSVLSALPNKIINRKKVGFNSPLSYWLKKNKGEYIRSYLLNGELVSSNIVDNNLLEKIINSHINNENDNSSILFKLLQTEIWIRSFKSHKFSFVNSSY